MNILILSSIYPQPDDNKESGVTKVVHSFAREWVKKGYNVFVIHNHTIYPEIYNKLLNSKIGKLNSKFGIVFPPEKQNINLRTEKDGVIIQRLSMKKYIPRISFSEKKIDTQLNTIINLLKSIKFKPDLVIGHWENPQIQLVSKLKDYYGIKSSLVFHEIVYSHTSLYRNRNIKYISNIDSIGARSPKIAKEVSYLYNFNKEIFICESGIPDAYFDNKLYPITKYENKINNSFIFVGRLVQRKNVDLIIKALEKYKSITDFTFNIIGAGEEESSLMNLTRSFQLNNRVFFNGFLNRNQIIEKLNENEIFIMLSENETFGLVYIEAMSRGCIVIASTDGGMKNIIQHGINGFLCDNKDENYLFKLLIKINNLSLSEKKEISLNAIKTAAGFKDSVKANQYLQNIL